MVKYQTRGMKPPTDPPINSAEFNSAVKNAVSQMFADGSKTVNIRHVCVIAGWKYNLSTVHRIVFALKLFGLQRADTKRALYVMPQDAAEV